MQSLLKTIAYWLSEFVINPSNVGLAISNCAERYHRHCLLAGGIIAIIAFPLSHFLKFNRRLEAMAPPSSPVVAAYHNLQQRFGSNEIVLAVYRDPRLWSPSGEGLDRLQVVSQTLRAVPGVRSVMSLSELESILESVESVERVFSSAAAGNEGPTRSLLDPNNKLAQSFAEVFQGYTHQPKSDYVAIACLLSPPEVVESYEETLHELRSKLLDLPEPATDGLLVGEPVLVTDGFNLLEEDGNRLAWASTTCVAVVLLVLFRSIRWTLIPLVVVHWSIWVTSACLVILGLQLTMVSSMLTAIVSVIGVATSVHVLLKYQEFRRQRLSRQQSMKQTVEQLAVPIIWACITDAIGFITLCLANVQPVRDFGFMMALASLSVLSAIALLVPGLALLGNWDPDPKSPRLDADIRSGLRTLLDSCLNHRPLIHVGLLAMLLLALLGSTIMKVETDFTKNFDRASPLIQGYTVIEREFGGAGVWDVMLPAPRNLNEAYLAQVMQFEDRLRKVIVAADGEQVTLSKVISIADADNAARSNPVFAALPVAARLEGMRQAMPDFISTLLTNAPDENDLRWVHILLRSREQVSAGAKELLVSAVSREATEFTQAPTWTSMFPSYSIGTPSPEITGYYVMLVQMVSNVLADQWKCFAWATFGIFVAISVATKSIRLGALALVPNVLPVLVVLGGMGWLGIRINIGAAMIAAVSIGLSIDSSIHYLLHYKQQLALGHDQLKALRSSQENVGLAVVLASTALITGFLSLTFSAFVPTVVFGILVSLTMLGGLLGNLILLPVLLAPRPNVH
ncbi:MAG: MMPL family transporter [Planctomycetales bacterium]|nr:MMPL family transporter [Planctomycetales bacterium]